MSIETEGNNVYNNIIQVTDGYVSWLPQVVIDFLNQSILGMKVGDLMLSFGIILLTLILRRILTRVFFENLKRLANKTKVEYDDQLVESLEKPIAEFFLVSGIYLAIWILPFQSDWQGIINTLYKGLSIGLIFWGILRMLNVFCDALADASEKRGSSLAGFVPLLNKSTRIFIIVLAIVMVLDNLGYSIGGILTGLGIGGAAFAFAAKDTIANIYGSIALALDRPFKVGDWIQVGDVVDGDVEAIGLRSTKVRTWPKTVISIPNAVLANEMINNWSRMPKRRVKQIVGVTYETKPDDMEGLVEDIRQLLREDEGVQQDFILVNFTDFGESSLNILVYYFTQTTQWLEHMDVRQRVNIKIMKAVESRGLSIAFPTRTVYFKGDVVQIQEPSDMGPSEPK